MPLYRSNEIDGYAVTHDDLYAAVPPSIAHEPDQLHLLWVESSEILLLDDFWLRHVIRSCRPAPLSHGTEKGSHRVQESAD